MTKRLIFPILLLILIIGCNEEKPTDSPGNIVGDLRGDIINEVDNDNDEYIRSATFNIYVVTANNEGSVYLKLYSKKKGTNYWNLYETSPDLSSNSNYNFYLGYPNTELDSSEYIFKIKGFQSGTGYEDPNYGGTPTNCGGEGGAWTFSDLCGLKFEKSGTD